MKIAIVNDMALAVEALRRVMFQAGHTVCWTAASGEEAVANCERQTPDLILMDLVMPGMGGVEATRRIMAATPCAILIVTVSVKGNTPMVFEAMGHGAIDAVDLPARVESDGKVDSSDKLLAKIAMIGRLTGDRPAQRHDTPGSPAASGLSLVAIGASAGGPKAVARVLSGLPAGFAGAVVVIQHIDDQFVQGMADWLANSSANPVQVASAGEHPQAGVVLLSAAHAHLCMDKTGRLGYIPPGHDDSYAPSVDVFFQSVNDHWSGPAIGVLLTGMGSDGAAGLKTLRDGGHHTIAQDRASSAVYGMPKAAAQLDAAVEVLALDRIAMRLRELAGAQSRRSAT